MRRSARRRCHAGVEWTCDDPKQHEQNQGHNNDADDTTDAISRLRCCAPVAIFTAAIETAAIAESAEQNDDDNHQDKGAHLPTPDTFQPQAEANLILITHCSHYVARSVGERR